MGHVRVRPKYRLTLLQGERKRVTDVWPMMHEVIGLYLTSRRRAVIEELMPSSIEITSSGRPTAKELRRWAGLAKAAISAANC